MGDDVGCHALLSGGGRGCGGIRCLLRTNMRYYFSIWGKRMVTKILFAYIKAAMLVCLTSGAFFALIQAHEIAGLMLSLLIGIPIITSIPVLLISLPVVSFIDKKGIRSYKLWALFGCIFGTLLYSPFFMLEPIFAYFVPIPFIIGGVSGALLCRDLYNKA
jgi:hypothetical protein